MSQLTTTTILTRLALGELSNLSLVDKSAPGTIKAEYIPTVVMMINQALRDIFSRMLLNQKEIQINQQADITHYFLREEFAIGSDSAQPIKYLDTSACPDFGGDVVKILAVYDGMGRQLFLNRMDEPLSVFTPQFDCLQITANHQSETFYVIYQSLHPTVTAEDDTVIDIPPSLEDAIVALIASKVYMNMNGRNNSTRGAMLDQQYERALMQAEVKDTASTSEGISNSKLDRSGFV